MVKYTLKSSQSTKPKVLNADQKFDFGPIKKGDRGYLNKNLTKNEEELGVGYLGEPTYETYIVDCVMPKETDLPLTLRVVPAKYEEQGNFYWDIPAKYFNKIPPLTVRVGKRLFKFDSEFDYAAFTLHYKQAKFHYDNDYIVEEYEARDVDDPDCPYFGSLEEFYEWDGEGEYVKKTDSFDQEYCEWEGEGKWVKKSIVSIGSVLKEAEKQLQIRREHFLKHVKRSAGNYSRTKIKWFLDQCNVAYKSEEEFVGIPRYLRGLGLPTYETYLWSLYDANYRKIHALILEEREKRVKENLLSIEAQIRQSDAKLSAANWGIVKLKWFLDQCNIAYKSDVTREELHLLYNANYRKIHDIIFDEREKKIKETNFKN